MSLHGEIAQYFFNQITYGKQNMVVRPLNPSIDRALRRKISDWNEAEEHDLIINTGDGYYIPRTDVPVERMELKEYLFKETSRALKLNRKMRHMNEVYERMINVGEFEEQGQDG